MNSLDIVGLVVFISMSVTILVLIGIAFRLAIKVKKATALATQNILDNGVLHNELLKLKSERVLEQNNDFVKFLSESRDWAFEYIEDVQKAIGAVKVSASYGKISEESLTELFNFLPESNKEKQDE